jgi:hypothetical protein
MMYCANSTRGADRWKEGNGVYKVNSAAAGVDQTIETVVSDIRRLKRY